MTEKKHDDKKNLHLASLIAEAQELLKDPTEIMDRGVIQIDKKRGEKTKKRVREAHEKQRHAEQKKACVAKWLREHGLKAPH